jgi:hypothetical protein
MARQETPRFKFPYPSSTAESWWETFQDFALSIDTTMLGTMEANAWTFVALPEATVESDGGGGYQVRLLGPCVVASRTYQTYVTIDHATPLGLVPGWLIVVRVASGARAAATTVLELRQNGVPIDPDYRVLGYVQDDASIVWWNASVLAPGDSRRLFSHVSSGIVADSLWARGLSSDGGTSNVSMAAEVRDHLDDETIHRSIDDGATTTTNLWSASKIAAEIGALAKKWTGAFDAVVPGGDVLIGSVDIGIAEGVLYRLTATVTAGNSDAVDVELGDSAFSGSPVILYQIGYDGVDPRWNPTEDGAWTDRNPAGIEGLTGGLLYWRVSNAGTTAVTVHVAVRGLGFEV